MCNINSTSGAHPTLIYCCQPLQQCQQLCDTALFQCQLLVQQLIQCDLTVHLLTHYRIEVTNRVIGHISTLVRETYPWLQLNNHPIFLMGDLNEDFHPVRILNQAGFTDCFTALGLPTPATHPARPSSPEEEAKSDRRVTTHFFNFN
jgi:hypothetical protein